MQFGDLAWNREHELVCPKNLIGSEMTPGSVNMRETGEVGGKDLNVPEAFIANLNHTTANVLKLTAQQDASFVVTNLRDGHKAYQQR